MSNTVHKVIVVVMTMCLHPIGINVHMGTIVNFVYLLINTQHFSYLFEILNCTEPLSIDVGFVDVRQVNKDFYRIMYSQPAA